MKKILLILPVGLLASLLVVMIVSTAFGQAGTAPAVHNADSYVNNFCFDGKVANMDVPDLTKKYTDMTNKFFNTAIAYIMTHPTEEIPSIDLNDYDTKGGGLCKGAKGVDLACQAIALCKDNASAYCVGITLLGFSPERYLNYDDFVLKNNYPQLKYSYFCYLAALNSKRDSIYDGTPQAILAKCDNGSEFADKSVCDLKKQMDQEKDPSKKAVLQNQLYTKLGEMNYWTGAKGALSSLTLTIVDLTDQSVQRVKFIDDEIRRSKQALDQTLDAYSQLKTAWNMHVKYMDTFADLVKYRDYLVAIRKQTDTFQFKFIDATTTKCL